MKKKKQLSERLPASSFILLSGLITAIASGLGTLLSGLAVEYSIFNISWTLFIAITWLPTILIITGQAFLFKYQFKWSATKWLLAGFFAIPVMIGWNFAQSILLAYISTLSFSWFLRRIPTVILALTQFVVLRQYVSRSWLWIIAMLGLSVINFPLFTLMNRGGIIPGSTMLAGVVSAIVIAGIQGTIVGMVLTWLFRMTVRDDTQHIEEAQGDENIANLTDIDGEIVNLEERIHASLHEKTGLKS